MRVESDGDVLNITVSIGVATLGDENAIEELIKKSDIALYEAKECGRNQVKVYDEK
jgi:diguanylate cyclase (GGDEF)-like protein